jgi:hypothetical protein
MIRKELYKTEDGRELYRAFSDTDHKIRKVNDGSMYTDAVDMTDNVEYEEAEEYIELEGASTYEEVLNSIDDYEKTCRKINRIGLTDNEALSVKDTYPRWESFVGKTIEIGFITLYGENLWRARQTHTALEVYPPSINTAALYEVIVESHTGEKDDPIPYTPPMEIFKNEYYTQNGVVYLCTRDSGVALSHDLSSLVGIYVELIG